MLHYFFSQEKNTSSKSQENPAKKVYTTQAIGNLTAITLDGTPDYSFNMIIDNQIFRQQPQNTFLIKATYRFVL